MTSTGIFAMACPACGGPLEPRPEPEGLPTGVHACTTCGLKYLVHLGYAMPVSSKTDRTAA
jgi:hypothetical protein